MSRPGVWITVLVLPLVGAGCSRHSGGGGGVPANPEAAITRAVPAGDADPGLELTTFVSGVDAHTLAATLEPFADQPVPIAKEMEDLWAAYGFRIISIPIEQVHPTVASLQTAGSTQRQWLGQAYSWTEVVRANGSSGKVIALDAERIRLAPGALRLLVRSWIEPTPPQVTVGEVSSGGGMAGAGDTAPGATLRVEMVPQNRESRTPEQALDPLAVNEPRLEAESQGLLFSRLYTRMSLAPGRALVIVPDRPDADWRQIAAAPVASDAPAAAPAPAKRLDDGDAVSWTKKPAQAEAAGAEVQAEKAAPPAKVGPPKLGEVVRAGPRPTDPAPPKPVDQTAAEVGPAPVRVPTLGEAMLMGDSSPFGNGANRRTGPVQRVVLVLVPRVPKEFRLLGPAVPAAAPVTPTAAPPLPG